MEQLSYRQDDLFLQAFSHAPIAMAVVSLDMKIIKINDSGCSIIGYSEIELLNKQIGDIIHPDDIEIDDRVLQELICGNQKTMEWETRFFHSSGKIIFIQLSVSLSRSIDDTPEFLIIQFQDVSEKKKKETDLQVIGKEYQLITENSLDMISKHLPTGEYTYISKACENLLGYKPSEIIGTSPFDYLHPEDINLLKQYVVEHVDKNVIHTLEIRLRHKNGDYHWFETTAKGIVNNQENIHEIIAFTRNITRRKNNQLKLKEREEQYRSLFDYHPDLIYSVNLNGYFTSVNQTFIKTIGLPEEDILQRRYNDMIYATPEEYQLMETNFQCAKKGEVRRYETEARGQEGNLVTIDVTNVPIRVDGEIVGVYGIARDISDRIKNEREISSTKRQLESFIENNVDPIFIFDLENRLVNVNPATETTYGWERNELIGEKLENLPIYPTIDEFRCALKNAEDITGKGKAFKGFETTRLKKDGSFIHVSVSGFQIRNEENEQIGWAVIHHDITEAKMAEEVLINSEKLSIAGQLAAGIAHEIRNPMTAIKGFIQLLKPDFTEKKDYFDIISSEIDRIEQIVSELLLLSKPQELKFKTVNMVAVLSEVKLLLETQAILNNVEIIFMFDADEIDVKCEVNQVKQVCINFIKNAIEAMPNGGSLFIEISTNKENEVRISFTDEGYGISSEILNKLGEPFYTTKEKGTGLGFMVSKRIIENHGGQVQVQSELGIGTKIDVYLPK